MIENDEIKQTKFSNKIICLGCFIFQNLKMLLFEVCLVLYFLQLSNISEYENQDFLLWLFLAKV